jgi:hypothetical protein
MESYTLDLNNWLTQVLADEMNIYLYGNGRIAQYNAGEAEYFLGDALDSVRQLSDSTGAVKMSKIYLPFGEVQSSAGAAVTNYGFTGEWADVTEPIYLRTGYYALEHGIFPDIIGFSSEGAAYALSLRNPGHPRRTRAGSDDRRGDDTDIPDLHIRPGGGGAA